MDRPRLLLADDEPDFLAVSARLLESEFDIVKTVDNGQRVVEEASQLRPDAMVLDISMPVLNGIEAARHLKAAGCPSKIIFLTVHREPEYVEAAFAAGANGYVLKSRLVSDLPVALRQVLAGGSFVSMEANSKTRRSSQGS